MRASASALVIGGLISAIGVGAAARSNETRGVIQDRAAESRAARARAAIAELDECIQLRFKDIDEGFGFRRIVKVGDTPHRFKPENAREESAVRDLEREGLRVVLYLTGRRVLTVGSGTPEAGAGSSLMNGPVEVTGAQRQGDVPSLDLRDDSRRAMIAFEREPSYDFAAGGWTFIARPVRATDTSCLRCHEADGNTRTLPSRDRVPSLRVGDALGVLLYGYKPAP